MAVSLNFSREEKGKLKEFLSGFEEIGKGTQFEEFRCRMKDCTITLYKTGKILIQGKCRESEEKLRDFILQNVKTADELILGIDETGRGENFGPLVIGAVLGRTNALRELRDSKKTAKIAEKFGLVEKNALEIIVEKVSAGEIDELRAKGRSMNRIEHDIIKEIAASFRKKHPEARIIVDGSQLAAPIPGVEFVPKADDLNPVVGAASVVARYYREKSADREKRKSWKN